LRLKPNHRTGSLKFYYDLLFDYPFDGVALRNMRADNAIDFKAIFHARPPKSPEELVAWLKEFRTRLEELIHNGESAINLLPE
jgi:hypothetical protein